MTGPSGGQQDSFPQETEASPTVHLALDHFDSIDVALNYAGAPGQCEAGGDGGEISFEAVDEGVEAWQVVGADGLDPLRELLALELGEHLPERADVPGKGLQFGAAGQDGLEFQALSLRQGVGVSQDPAGDRAWGRRTGCRCGRGCAERPEGGADGSVTASVAVRLKVANKGVGRVGG